MSSHPDISGFTNTHAFEDEGQHLQTVYCPAYAYDGIGKFAFHAEAHLDETSPLITLENRFRLYAQWGKYWDAQKPCLLEKSPPNLIRARFLQALFSESHFIFLMRHPVPLTYAMHKWMEYPVQDSMEHWKAAHTTLLHDLPYIKNHTIIRYEDFVQDPNGFMTRIYNALGLSAHPVHETILPDVNDHYFRKWEQHISFDPALMEQASQLSKLPETFGYYMTPPYVREHSSGSIMNNGCFLS